MEDWSDNRDALHDRIHQLGSGPEVLISNPTGSVVISHGRYHAHEGVGEAMSYAVLGLCTGGGGRTRRESEQTCLDDVWRPNRAGLLLPGPAAQGFTPSMEMLTIAFNLNEIPACHGEKTTAADLVPITQQLIDDELIEAVMMALLRDAEAHGAASAFFDHGLSLILHQLGKRARTSRANNTPNHASRKALESSFELIESHLGDDLRVREMAAVAGIDTRTLTRLFKRETGYTPFQYLTRRRMARAKELLQAGESITNTALAVGYINPAKFSAAFRRWVGMTPSAWKHTN